MKEFLKGFKEGLAKALYVPPVYASVKPSDASLVEGWKVAHQMLKAKLTVAEKRLELLDKLADGIIEHSVNPQYGRDIKTILHMTEAELNEDYGGN